MKENIFNILKIQNSETAYSNMLIWLLNPNGSHGLGNKFIKEFILANDNESKLNDSDFSSFDEIKTEVAFGSSGTPDDNSGRIDLLLVSEKLVVCIENKVDTTEHDNQLQRYEQYISSKYSQRKIFIYLTPLGEEPSCEPWKKMDFQTLKSLMEKVSGDCKDEKVSFLIKDFIAVIEAKVEELSTVDNLFKSSVDSWYKNRGENFKNLTLVNCTGMNAQFSDSTLDNLFPASKEPGGKYNKTNLYFIEIKFEKAEREKGELKCLLTFTNHQDNLKKDSQFHKLFPEQTEEKRWFCVKSISASIFGENETAETFFKSPAAQGIFSSTLETLLLKMNKYIEETIKKAE